MDLSSFPHLPQNQVFRGLRGSFVNSLVDMIRDRGVPRNPYSMTDAGGTNTRGKSQSKDQLSWVRCFCDDNVPAYGIVEVYDGRLDTDGIILHVRVSTGPSQLYAGNEHYELVANAYGWVKLITPYEPVLVRTADVYSGYLDFGDHLDVVGDEVQPATGETVLISLVSVDPSLEFGTGTGSGTGTGDNQDLTKVPVLGSFPSATIRVAYIDQTGSSGFGGGGTWPAYITRDWVNEYSLPQVAVSLDGNGVDSFWANPTLLKGVLFTGQRILLGYVDSQWYILPDGEQTWPAVAGGSLYGETGTGTGTGSGHIDTATITYFSNASLSFRECVVPLAFPLDPSAAITGGTTLFVTWDNGNTRFCGWFAGCPVYTE